MIDNNLLTITIPTYNRNAILKKNLAILLPQTRNICNVIVIDNHSEIPVSETLFEEIAEYSNLQIIRNEANVGLSGNLIKCFEICKTEWVWLIGDDDTTTTNAVETVQKYIFKYPKAHYINFTSDLVDRKPEDIRKTDVTAVGPNDFVEKIDDYSNIVFLSVGIYRRSQVIDYMRFAYLFAYTLCPHTALLFASINENSQIVFSPKKIIERYIIGTQDAENTWSQLFIRLSVPTLFEVPINLNKKNKYKWNRILHDGVGRPIRSLSEVIMYLGKKDRSELMFLFGQIGHRIIPFGVSIFWRVEFLLCYMILRVPFLSKLFRNLNIKLRNKRGKVVSDADMFSRI